MPSAVSRAFLMSPMSLMVALLLLLTPEVTRAGWLAVSWSGDIWSIDPQAATMERLGASEGAELNSLTVDPPGRILSIDGDGFLVSIDAASGVVQSETPLDFGDVEISVRALALSPEGELFAVNGVEGSMLFRIDPATGQGWPVGPLAAYFTQSLEFSPEGVLYAWGRDRGLYTIDTRTAEIEDVNPVAVGPFLQSLAFAPDGRLLGVRTDRGVEGSVEEIYEVDLETGTAAPLAIGVHRDLRGIVFVP